MQEFRVSIKGPLTTPVGGGIRSLNVTLRQVLDLYACIRPVRYFEGVGSPMKEPEKLNIVVFRENTEDVYAGIEWKAGSPEAEKLRAFIEQRVRQGHSRGLGDRHQADVGVRLEAPRRDGDPLRAQALPAVGDVDAQGQHHEVHRRRVPRLGLRGGARASSPTAWSPRADLAKGGAGARADAVIIKDRIADSMFQQLLLRPDEYSVIATPNLNGDYVSDAAAAQVGGLGHRAGRQRRRRRRRLRGDARHRAQVREPRQDQSRAASSSRAS